MTHSHISNKNYKRGINTLTCKLFVSPDKEIKKTWEIL